MTILPINAPVLEEVKHRGLGSYHGPCVVHNLLANTVLTYLSKIETQVQSLVIH